VRIEPGLDTSWLAGVQYSKRDELSRLGHAYGTAGLQFGTADVLSYKKPSVAWMQARKFLQLAATCHCDDRTILAGAEETFTIEHVKLDWRGNPETAAARRNGSREFGFALSRCGVANRELFSTGSNRWEDFQAGHCLLDPESERSHQ